jgi:hypothetical protein
MVWVHVVASRLHCQTRASGSMSIGYVVARAMQLTSSSSNVGLSGRDGGAGEA